MGSSIHYTMKANCQKVPSNTTEEVGGQGAIPGHTGSTRLSMHLDNIPILSFLTLLIEKFSWIIDTSFGLAVIHILHYLSKIYPDIISPETVSKSEDFIYSVLESRVK